MSFQTPEEIAGVSVFNFLRTAKGKIDGKNVNYFDFKEEFEKNAKALKMKADMINRDLNVGFSGGEKKKDEKLILKKLRAWGAGGGPLWHQRRCFLCFWPCSAAFWLN